MREDDWQEFVDHEVLWQGVVKIDPSISIIMREATDAGNGLKLFTIVDSTFPYDDNAQLDNPDLVKDFPNSISIYVTGGKILEYMKCSVIKRYRLANNDQKISFFKRRKRDVVGSSSKKIVILKGFLLSPVNITNDHTNHTGCLASVRVTNEYGEAIIFEKTGVSIFAAGSKTSDVTFTNQMRSATTIFIASDEKPLIAYVRTKSTLVKLFCDSSGIKTEKTLEIEGDPKNPRERQQIEDPLQILKIRLAKGEISIEEYSRLRRLVSDDESRRLGEGSNWI